MKERKSMFFPAKHKKYANIVSIKSIDEANESINKLISEFNSAATRTKRVRIIRVATLASNRAKAMAKKGNLSADTRRRLLTVSKMYSELSGRLSTANDACY